MLKNLYFLILLTIHWHILLALPNPEITEQKPHEILKEIAQKLTSSLHPNIDPCTSIAKHVCGNDDETFKESSIIEQQRIGVKDVEALLERTTDLTGTEIKLKNYLTSCKNREQSKYREQFENLEIAKLLGGWPELNKDGKFTGTFDWMKLAAIMHRHHMLVLFAFQYHREHGTTIYYKFAPINEEISREVIKDRFKKLGFFDGDEKLLKVSTELEKFVNELTKIGTESKHSLRRERTNLTELQKQLENIDLKIFLDTYFETDIDFNSPDKVLIHSIESFKNTMNFIKDTDKRILANYFMWRIAATLTNEIDRDCTADLDIFNYILDGIFLRHMSSPVDEKLLFDINNELQNTLIQNKDKISEIPYDIVVKIIDNDMKFLENIRQIMSEERLDNLYSDLRQDPSNYLQNILNLRETGRKSEIKEFLGQIPISRDEQKEIRELFDIIQSVRGYPASVIFPEIGYRLLKDVVFYDYEHLSDKKFELISNCFNESLHERGEIIVDYVMHNDVTRMINDAFDNWIKKNKEVVEKENNILKEFKLNSKKLFLLILSQNLCFRSQESNEPLRHLRNNELVLNEFGCTNAKEPQNECKLYN